MKNCFRAPFRTEYLLLPVRLYRALADAILDEEKVAALDAFPRWKQVEPIPLDEPWENLGN